MKHIYVINPAAGRGDSTAMLTRELTEAYADAPDEKEIYHTAGVGDAVRYVRERCLTAQGEPLRFYACGGDGTLGEVVNGAIGYPAAEVGMIPVGTGNDFMRNFTEQERFRMISAQRNGTGMVMDLLRCNDVYCVNMINIGFDCEVVAKTAEIKRKPYVPGGMSYITSLLITLIRKPGVSLRLWVDGEEQPEEKRLLCAIGNGAFCGGGFRSLPRADLKDGVMDACLVKNISRTRFLRLVGDYKAGTHLKPETEDIIEYRQCRQISMRFSANQNVCIDGEVSGMDHCDITVAPSAIRFVVPEGCRPLVNGEEVAEEPAATGRA